MSNLGLFLDVFEVLHCNGKHYNQLLGTVKGSPISVVVTAIFMQNIEEEHALATYTRNILPERKRSKKKRVQPSIPHGHVHSIRSINVNIRQF